MKLNGQVVSSYSQIKHQKFRSYVFIVQFVGIDGTLKATKVTSKDSNYLQHNESVRVFIDPKNLKFVVVKRN